MTWRHKKYTKIEKKNEEKNVKWTKLSIKKQNRTFKENKKKKKFIEYRRSEAKRTDLNKQTHSDSRKEW